MTSKKTLNYIKKLQDKNIKIIPLEPYTISTVEIKHKCECGKEYQQTPKRALLNNRCGCVGGRQKPTTKQFNEKLKNKNIETRIIGEYTDIFEKTLCRCVCGNEWETTPQSLLKGSKCGCMPQGPQVSHEEYLLMLLDKNIATIPIEKYITMETKIKHKCICGNIWSVKPVTIVNRDGHCGCRKLLQEEEIYRGKPTVLYYIKIGELYKIGLAMMQKYKTVEKAIEARYRQDSKIGLEYEIVTTKLYDDGIEALIEERRILEENLEFRYLGEKILIGGNTELFIKDIKY
jgi:hypothetical protein